jgi:hypothetical protein
MLITASGVEQIGKFKQWDNEQYSFIWQGFFYIPGIQAGEESVRAFAAEVVRRGILYAITLPKGNFFIVMKELKSNQALAFVDNSGVYNAFCSDHRIASSFLHLVRDEGISKAQIDPKHMIEFINFGSLHMGKTFFKSVRKIDGNEIIRFTDFGKTYSIPKGLKGIDSSEEPIDFMQFFENLAKSIQSRQISVDLTGGYDSRLLAVVLDYFGLPFETSCSGVAGILDQRIPTVVAEKLGHPFDFTHHTIDHLQDDIRELFTTSDGLDNVFRQHRTIQYQKNRVNRGVNLAISGAGGELYRDLFWLQDFPFYAKRTTNLDRLIHRRILSIPCSNRYLQCDWHGVNNNFAQQLKQELSGLVLDQNSKSYDNIFYNFRMKTFGGRFITSFNNYLDSYAPFLDAELVHFGFMLRRRDRFFNNFHRKIITQLNPAVSRIPTTERVSSSAIKLEIFKDINKYIVDKGLRLAKKIGQKTLKKTYFQQSANHSEMFQRMRRLDLAHDAIRLLQNEHIISKQIELKDIGNHHIGNFISLAMFMDYLDGGKKLGVGDPLKQLSGV